MNREIGQLITVLGKEALKEPQLHSFLTGDCQAAMGKQAYFSRLLCSWRALDRTSEVSEVTQSCLISWLLVGGANEALTNGSASPVAKVQDAE